MAETTVRFNINLQMSGSGSRNVRTGPQGSIQEVEKKTFDAFNYAFQDIAFKAAKNQQRAIQNQIEARLSGIAMSEIARMGQKINSLAVGIGPLNQGPRGGSLEIEGPISNVLRRTDPSRVQPMTIRAVTGQWRARTQEYLRRKAKKFGHRKWWYNTGELASQLRNPQMWIGAYGPVRVAWLPERIETGYAKGGAIRYSSLARGAGRSYTVSTGQIQMRVLGRITKEMLNSPGSRSYDSRFNGLLDSLPESVEKKLASKGDPYRPIIEPFLTFYINRQIPNRIFHALTETIGGGRKSRPTQSIRPLGVTKG